MARQSHDRQLELVRGDERKVPLRFHWVGDMLVTEQLEAMAQGDDAVRTTPALVFCFNREECWNVAEQLKGKRILSDGQQKRLVAELDRTIGRKASGRSSNSFCSGASACIMPECCPSIAGSSRNCSSGNCFPWRSAPRRFRRASTCRPARSLSPSIMKGPPGKKKLLDPSTAHQIFGRAGRPQFDTEGTSSFWPTRTT